MNKSLRILVAIANYGTKNARYLERLLQEYRSMTRYDVHVAVLSNIAKNLGREVEVIVGLPISDPWSLPFGYKRLFAERKELYDLFIYSEDDTLITERNIDAFLQITQVLPDSSIAGFIRYETAESGKKYYSTFHAHYHWDPASVLKMGEHIFAHYTNEHSACFILTQKQLKKAIGSGGFFLPPRKGRYDMLVTAATEPYTQCGMKKLICISHLNDFCLHHLPNLYCGKIGIDAEIADREIEKLKSLPGTTSIRGPLFDTHTLLSDSTWDKAYHELSRKDILSLIPRGVKRVLSVGCGCGSTEFELGKRGIEVAGIPLDCIVGVTAAAKGVRILPPSFDQAMKSLSGERFDCILFADVLQHLPKPISTLRAFLPLLGKDGWVVISVPNFHHPSILRKKMLGRIILSKVEGKRTFEKYKVHLTTRRVLLGWLKRCDLGVVNWFDEVNDQYQGVKGFMLGWLKGILARNVVVAAQRNPGREGLRGGSGGMI